MQNETAGPTRDIFLIMISFLVYWHHNIYNLKPYVSYLWLLLWLLLLLLFLVFVVVAFSGAGIGKTINSCFWFVWHELSCQSVHCNDGWVCVCRPFSPAQETCYLTVFLMGPLDLNWRVVLLRSTPWRSSSRQTRQRKRTDLCRASPMPGNLLRGH